MASTSHTRRLERRAANEAPKPDGRQKILLATERLLETTPLSELSVARIAAEADVSRGTFYLHFESKYEPVTAQLSHVMEQMYDLLEVLTTPEPGQSLHDQIHHLLSGTANLWNRHRAVFRATHENYIAMPEFREPWLAFTEQWTDALADALRDRDDGTEAERRQWCASLVWATEHLYYVAGSGVDDDLPSPAGVVDTLARIWVATIEGAGRVS